ncbi:MAG: DUF1365 family protein [Sphingomicrobium sp.]
MTRSALYIGKVMHRRLRPRLHQLRYRLFSLLLDLDEIDGLARSLRLFSRNRFNLIAFHDRDHGDGSREPLRTQVEGHVRAAGLTNAVGAIELLAMPRVLGFVFNPISLYFCRGRDGRLIAILYEVSNTFGERHTYVMPVAGEGTDVRQNCAKRFHVSPFLPMRLHYSFRVRPPAENLLIAINVVDANGPILVALQTGTRRALSDATLVRAMLAYPLMSWKVVAGILWEAGRLSIKRVPVHRHVDPPARAASYGPCPQASDRRAEAA